MKSLFLQCNFCQFWAILSNSDLSLEQVVLIAAVFSRAFIHGRPPCKSALCNQDFWLDMFVNANNSLFCRMLCSFKGARTWLPVHVCKLLANFFVMSHYFQHTHTHTHTIYIYIYIYSQILNSNGIPHIHVFSQVDMLLTRWKENPLQPTGHCVASTVGPHSIPMDSYFLWLQASQRIGTNACQFPVSDGGHRFSEIRTKNGKLILLQNKLVRCQLLIGCIIPILCNLWYRLNFSKFFCKARFRFYIWGKTLKPMV
jgi:hypothetical protein